MLGFFPVIEPQGPKVAIVGAGLAGLSAARELRRLGVSTAVYEARNTVGGRVRTETSGSRVIEMGAEFIDSNHRHVLSAAKALGLKLRDLRPPGNDDKPSFVIVDGKRRTDEQIERALRPILQRIERDFDRITTSPYNEFARKLDRMPISEYVEGIEAEKWAKSFFALTRTAEYGLDANEQSSLNLFGLFEPEDTVSGGWGNADERWTIIGGNQQLPEGLAKGLTIEFEEPLKAIRKRGKRVELTFATGPKSFDAVILAIPFSVLRTVDIDGVFTRDRQDMIESLGYGTHTKVQLEVADWTRAKADWNGDLLIEPFSGWEGSRFQPGKGGHLTVLAGGMFGRSFGEENIDEVVRTVAPLGTRLGNNHRHKNWTQEPFARGSYSNYRVGEFVRFAGKEGQNEGMIFFAGEHCSSAFRSTMNGALESGIKAARLLAKSLR